MNWVVCTQHYMNSRTQHNAIDVFIKTGFLTRQKSSVCFTNSPKEQLTPCIWHYSDIWNHPPREEATVVELESLPFNLYVHPKATHAVLLLVLSEVFIVTWYQWKRSIDLSILSSLTIAWFLSYATALFASYWIGRQWPSQSQTVSFKLVNMIMRCISTLQGITMQLFENSSTVFWRYDQCAWYSHSPTKLASLDLLLRQNGLLYIQKIRLLP